MVRVASELRTCLEAALAPRRLEIEDQSAHHVGHAGWRVGGETHFHVSIVSDAFRGKSRLERQRLVHAAAASLLRREIHALSISALAPDEPPAEL